MEQTSTPARRRRQQRGWPDGYVKTPKIYAADTGMACHLSAVDIWPAIQRFHLVGPLVETWAHAELRKLLELQARHTELSFWRTHTGQEVDFILERGGQLAGIEVKWSATLDRRHLRALHDCRQTLAPRWRMGGLLHGGTEPIAPDDQTAAIPFSYAFA
jgi:predicted AAA+ superfamily ATPase